MRWRCLWNAGCCDSGVQQKPQTSKRLVQFEQLRRQQPHRVHVQIATEVGDLDLAAARRHARVQRHRGRGRHLLVHEALRCHQLQRRVVRQAHHRQQRGAGQELVGRDLAHRQVMRPGALLLADVHVVLDDVALRRLEFEAAAHQRFGLGVAAQHLQQPGAVVQRMQAQFGRGGRVGIVDGSPARQRAFGVAAALEQMAQIEQRRCEARQVFQPLLVGGFCGIAAAAGRQQRAPVKARHMAQRRGGVGEPGLVQLCGGCRQAARLQFLRAVHQVLQAQPAAARGLQQRLVLGRGRFRGDGRGRGMRHGDNGRVHPAPPGCRFLAC